MRVATVIAILAVLAVGIFVTACSQPVVKGTADTPAANAAGDASAQLQNSFDNSLPPLPSGTSSTSNLDSLDSDLAMP